MKDENRKIAVIIMIAVLFGTFSASYCYNLGKTGSFLEAFTESWQINIIALGWIPIVLFINKDLFNKQRK